jgi:Flp pilus assembly protein TadD
MSRDPIALSPLEEAEALLAVLVGARARLLAMAAQVLPHDALVRLDAPYASRKGREPTLPPAASKPRNPTPPMPVLARRASPPPARVVISGGNRSRPEVGMRRIPETRPVTVPSQPPPPHAAEALEAPEAVFDGTDAPSPQDQFKAAQRLSLIRKSPPPGPRLTEEEAAPLPSSLSMDPDAFSRMLLASTGSSDPTDEERLMELNSRASVALQRGDLHAAIEVFDEYLEFKPDDANVLISRGRCRLDLGDFGAAMSDFQKAQDLDADAPGPCVGMGDIHFARKDYRRAIEYFDAALELDPKHAMAFCRRGVCQYYRKNFDEAVLSLQRAHALDPRIPNLVQYIKMVEKKLGR